MSTFTARGDSMRHRTFTVWPACPACPAVACLGDIKSILNNKCIIPRYKSACHKYSMINYRKAIRPNKRRAQSTRHCRVLSAQCTVCVSALRPVPRTLCVFPVPCNMSCHPQFNGCTAFDIFQMRLRRSKTVKSAARGIPRSACLFMQICVNYYENIYGK